MRAAHNKKTKFEAEARVILDSLRSKLRAVLRASRLGDASAAEVAKVMGLERKLAWQLCKLADDACAVSAKHVPGAIGIARFLDAALKRGVSPRLHSTAAAADARFRAFQRRQAPNRELFDAMLNGVNPRSGAAADELAVRRSAFRANSVIWGSQVRVQVVTVAIAPNRSDSDHADWMMLCYYCGFQRLRQGISSILGRYSYYVQHADAIHHQSAGGSEPIEPRTAAKCGGVPAIERFTSKPLPAMVRERCAPTYVQDVLLPGEVGPEGAVDIATGEVRRRLGYRWAEQDPDHYMYGARVRTPAELLVLDIWQERGMFPPPSFESAVYSTLHNEGSEAIRPQNLIPMPVKVRSLGEGMAGAAIDAAPNYAGMLRHATQRCGWEPQSFYGYRAMLEYPVLPSLLWVKHTIPRRPA